MSIPLETINPVGILDIIRSEMTGASSSLNMPPEPLDNVDPSAFYMTDKFVWAQHSQAHIHAAITNMNTLDRELRDIHAKLYCMSYKSDDATTAQALLILSERLSKVLRAPYVFDFEESNR